MDPDASARWNELKRPRNPSWDDEPDRPPPGQREVHPLQDPGSTNPPMTSLAVADLRNAGGQRRASVEVTPPINSALSDSVDNETIAAPDPCLSQLHKHAAASAIHTSSPVDDHGVRMPGTWAFTLEHLQSLVGSVGSDDPDIIWIHGPAGDARSGIVRTMANDLKKQGVLLGSFFFFQSDAKRNTSAPFIPTLALQSFTSVPATQSFIREVVHSQSSIFSQPTLPQFQALLETPLKLAAGHESTWTTESPLVLVIDSLDECAGTDHQVEIIRAMRQLASTIRSTNHRVKILIASRSDRLFEGEFGRNRNSTTIIKLSASDANIDFFCDTRLAEIRRDNNLSETWPSPQQVKWFKKKTSCQYSFALISMAFLAGGDPVKRLEMLETELGTHGPGSFEALDALYAIIFRQIPPDSAEQALFLVRFWTLRPQFANRFYNNVLEHILALPHGFHSRLLPYLSPLFNVGYSYRPLHTSLSDFLGDASRSRKYMLFLDSLTVSTSVVEGMLKLCIPPKSPVDKNTAESWFKSYDKLAEFLFQFKPFLHFYPLPTLDATLDQLRSLLPTMDLYAFGYCNCLLSILFENGRSLALNPSHFDTIETLLDQILTIQRFRFATYEAIEAGGDSGLGFFGLLLVFISNSCVGAKHATSHDTRQCRVDQIAGYLVRIHEDNPNATRNTDQEKSLSLRYMAQQLSTSKEIKGTCDNRWRGLKPSMSLFALLSTPIEDKLPGLSHCLSRTIEMFLDLPSQNTRIQDQLSRFISCQDHSTLLSDCQRCMSNLEQAQTSVVHAVVKFVETDHPAFRNGSWLFDVRTFARCDPFVASADRFDDRVTFFSGMVRIGEAILRKIEREEPKGPDTSVAKNLYIMLSSLHKRAGLHKKSWESRDACHVCSKVQLL